MGSNSRYNSIIRLRRSDGQRRPKGVSARRIFVCDQPFGPIVGSSAIIAAGPFGLSVAARLRSSGV
jgi:hypothetical protein